MEVQNSGAESQGLDRSQSIQKPDGDGTKMVGGLVGVVADGGGGGVKVEVGNAVGGAEVVKRKRGRPPRAQANQPSAKKIKEEDEDEDVCFICFDGGSLVLCDRRGCPKAYHPACIKRDEAFFQTKAKWNCGWHICSICEKTSHHMCYTCTYSLCKGCSKKADFKCVRGDKGFCNVCMKTIMLIEHSAQGKEVKVDFDDKTSWEYLFKVYWVYLKGKLSLTYNEITEAQNPWKRSDTITSSEPISHISASGRRSITSDMSFGNLAANESKNRITFEQTNEPPKETPCVVESKEWASKELLDFISHVKNGDVSVLSQFDVQALLLDYIKRNNLRDPRKKTQIICDSRLKDLFGKPRVGHIEMLKLLELHFFIKEDDSQKKITIESSEKQVDADYKPDNMNMVVVSNKERRSQRKVEQRTTQNKLDEYASIDVHNMNLIYLRRNLMEKIIDDSEKFHEKVVGSIVQIRISGSDQKDDMYRLVQVVGTTKVDVPYKVGDKLVDVMLEVSNLDKKETVPIDTISNQELSEDECRRLRESIRCGLVRCFTVGEIQEKAMALQSLLVDDRMEAEMLRLNHLRDRASEKRQKKGLRECVQKLQLLKTPEERERRLREVPEVHSDPKMNPDYESDDTEEYFNNEHESPGEHHQKPKFPWASGTNTISPQKRPESSNDQKDTVITNSPVVAEDSNKATTTSETEKDTMESNPPVEPPKEVNCNGSTIPESNSKPPVTSSLPTIVPESKIETPVTSSLPTFVPESKIETHVTSSLPTMVPQSKIKTHVSSSLPAIVPESKIETPVSSSLPTVVPESTPSSFLSMLEHPSPSEDMWHYRDPSGNVQGPFSMLQLQKWSAHGYFPSDLRIWAGRESNSVLLNDALHQQFNNNNNNYNSPWPTNVANNQKISNQVKEVNVPETSYAMNSVNLEKSPDANNYNLNCNPPNVTSTDQFDTQKEVETDMNMNQHVSQVFPVADEALVDLQSQLLKKETHESEKEKQQSVQVQASGNTNAPTWSTALSLVIGGAQLPETGDEWGRYPPTVSVSPLKPLEVLDHHHHHQVATTNMDHIMHHSSSPPSSSQPYNNLPTWHGLGETIEFATLAEESVSDLLAEVDAMESRNGVPSPTSRRNSFLEDLFNGSMDDFSPTDQSTDMQLHRQSTALHQFSFGLETKPAGAVGIPATNSEFKWADMGGSELPPPRQDMIDLNDSTRAEADELERDDQVEEKSSNGILPLPLPLPLPPPPPPEPRGGRRSKGGGGGSGWPERESERVKAEVSGRKFGGFPDVEEEEGEFIQPEAQPPLLPLPPPLTMGLDVVDSRRMGSEKFPGRTSQGATSGSRVHSRSVNVGRESHHRRSSGGDRYNISNSISPRDRAHHIEDSGHSRSSRASWGRQSSFGSGGGGGYSRAPPVKGQRVCKFYESGRCKKGSSCSYLHPER